MLAEVSPFMAPEKSVEVPRHRPVLLRETLELLSPKEGSVGVDCTVGTGGHAEALLLAIGESGRLLGLDRDAESIRIAVSRLASFGERFEPIHADFRTLPSILSGRGIAQVEFLLADLGFSSYQMDTPERGFSFAAVGPLDMRMDRSGGPTAAELVASLPEGELARILREYGEERSARRIARALVRAREKRPIGTTLQLSEIVSRCSAPQGRGRIHPATRTFQALRIAVNRELEGLDRFVSEACRFLAPGGRAAFIAFHSLEDRVVKQTLLSLTRRCICPPDLPRCVCGRPGIVERINRKAARPGEEEVRSNPRSRSARLRAVRRLADPAAPDAGSLS